jgi:hypothetical protein
MQHEKIEKKKKRKKKNRENQGSGVLSRLPILIP